MFDASEGVPNRLAEPRVSSKKTEKNFSVRTETNWNKICFGYVSVCSLKPKTKKFGFASFCLGVSTYIETTERTKLFQKNRNNPKFSEKKQNMLSNNLFRLVFCLFGFNRNIETLCFGTEAKQPKLTVSRQMKKTKKPQQP
jgi:hypothetical protein